MNCDEFISRLEHVRKSGEASWMARCPAHDDKTASLSIKDSNGKILITCHAGCSTASVLSALGLKLADLFSEPRAVSPVKQIIAEYNYFDEHCQFLYQTVRYDPKDFRQRTKDAAGNWVWSLKGIRLVPYKLPEALLAIEEGKPLFVAEGEKDCDCLWKNGFAATCNPLGAGTINHPKWRDEFAEHFRGVTRVSIIADNDEKPNRQGEWVGKEHAITVAESFLKICPDVRVGILPNNNGHRTKDAYDWFSHGGTPAVFEEIVSKLSPFNPDDPFPRDSVLENVWKPSDLMAFDSAHDPNAVIGLHDGKTTRFLCKGYGSWIIASSGLGKSSLAIQQAILWCLGRPFFGTFPVRPLRILFVQSENDEGDMAEPVQGVLDSIEITTNDVKIIDSSLKIVRCRGLTGTNFCNWLEKQISSHQADIVYVDPLLRFAGVDVTRTDQATRLLNDSLDPILARTGVVLIGIHHTGKPKQDKSQAKGITIYDYMYSGLGSSELVNWARAVTVILPIAEGIFEVKLAKRGKRAWATHPDGSQTTSIFLKHHEKRIFWLQIEPPPPPSSNPSSKGRPSKVDQIASMNLHSFCAACNPEGEGLNEISKRLEMWLAHEKIDASTNTCKRSISALVANGKILKSDLGSYLKGPSA